MDIMQFATESLIVEALWETTKMFIKNGKEINIDRVGAVAFGELIAITGKMDFLASVGVSINIPIIGMILTGLLISRGANFMHDIVSSIGNVYQGSKPEDPKKP